MTSKGDSVSLGALVALKNKEQKTEIKSSSVSADSEASKAETKEGISICFLSTWEKKRYRLLRALFVLQKLVPICYEGKAIYHIYSGKHKVDYKCKTDSKSFTIELAFPDWNEVYSPFDGLFSSPLKNFSAYFIEQITKLGIKFEKPKVRYGTTITIDTQDSSLDNLVGNFIGDELMVTIAADESEKQRLFSAIPAVLQQPAIKAGNMEAISQLAKRIVLLSLAKMGIKKKPKLEPIDVINTACTSAKNSEPVIVGFRCAEGPECHEALKALGFTVVSDRWRRTAHELIFVISNPELLFKKGLEFQAELNNDLQKTEQKTLSPLKLVMT